jgi:hypothetical protein
MPIPRRRLAPTMRALTAIVLLLSSGPLHSEEPSHHIQTARTKDLRLVYLGGEHAYIVPHLIRCFENSLNFHRNLFAYDPNEDVTVILQDADDFGYAGTTALPFNFLTIGIEPFEHVYETCPTNERINWVMNHELVHLVASDQASSHDRFWRSIFFGKVTPTDEDPVSILYSYLTNPRRYAPRWYHEGLAVFMETWMAGGIGRAQNGYDEMVFRTMVRDSSYFYDVVGIESEGTAKDFQTGQLSYLYGTRFVSYLAYQYGPEKIVEWGQRCNGSKAYFSSQFKHVFERPLDDEWRSWVAWEHAWQRTNLDSIRQYPTTPYRVLSARPLGSVSRAVYDPQRAWLVGAVRYPGEFAHVQVLDLASGKSRKVCDVASPALYYVTSLAYDDSTGTVFFTTNNARGWRNLVAADVMTGHCRTLLAPCRIGDLAFNQADHSLWGVQHHNGLVRICRIPAPYEYWQEIFTLSYKEDLYDIDISPDGRYLTGILVGVTGQPRLMRIEIAALLQGGGTYEVLHEFGLGAPGNFVFAPDGHCLYGTSYYTGTSNVFRYDFTSGEMACVTNAETGFFRPVPLSADSLAVFRYTGDGFVPVMIADTTLEDVSAVRFLGTAIAERYPLVRSWVLGSPREIDPDSVVFEQGDYHAWRNVRLNAAYPIAEGYKDYGAVGLRGDWSDPVYLNALTAAASYTPNDRLPADERLHLRFSYRRAPWTLEGDYNRADFYDFFGPTRASRKGYQLVLGYDGQLLDRPPRQMSYALRVAGYWGLEELPWHQDVRVTYDNFLSSHLSLRYSNLSGTIGGVEAEKGLLAGLGLPSTLVRNHYYPRVYSELTYGFLLPLDHSSFWLRGAAGYGHGGRDNPFANFYFGGFGNNWVDHGSVNRYRTVTSFPGLEISEVGGQNFLKGGGEWTLPPLRFKRWGVSAFYFTWLRLAFFANALVPNFDSDQRRRTIGDVGCQLNAKLVLFSSLESTLSLGYASAFEKGQIAQDEFMASLKILR